MKLDRVDIQRLPGISEPFSVDGLSPGVNIIVGPNGSGKSSLCRAVRGTLWPTQLPADGVELDSFWTGPEGPLRAEVRGGVQWRGLANGEPTDAPALPNDHLAHCYTLDLKDLLDAGSEGDRALADRLRVQMAGGFDLAAVARGLHVSRQHGKRESSEVAEARRALQVLEGERRALGRDADRLATLREQLRSAENASEQLSRLHRVREVRERQFELSGVLERIAGCPEGLAALSGRELDEWDELARDIVSLEAEIADADERLAAAEAECSACGIGAGPVDEAELRSWLERARVLADTERSLLESLREAAETASASRAAADALAGNDAGHDLAALDSPALDAVDVWIADAIESAERRQAIEARLAVIPEVDADDLDRLHRADERLREWLSSAGAPSLPARRELLVGCAVLALGGGLAVLVGSAESIAGELSAFAESPEPLGDRLLGLVDTAGTHLRELVALVHPAWWLAVGLVSGALGVGSWLERAGGVDRSRIETRYAELDVAPPSEWEPEFVRARLTQVEADVRHCERARELAAEREGLVAQVESLAIQEAKLRERRGELSEQIGVDPGARTLRLADWTIRLRSWREAVVAEQTARRRCDLLRDEARTRAVQLRGFLAGLGECAEGAPGEERSQAAITGAGSAEEAPALRAMLESLRDRGEHWRRARERAVSAGRDRVARSRHLREFEARRGALLRRVSIDPRADAGPDDPHAGPEGRTQLASLVEAWPAYRADCARRAQLELRIEEIRTQLANDLPVLDIDPAELAAAIDECEARSASGTELALEVGGIEARVRDASEGDARERAAAALTTAESALEESLAGLRIAAAGRFLLADVEAEHEAQSRPDVLRRATETFASFTHHHFALEMTGSDAGGRFRARETATGRMRELGELSDGTRMQLLLAVRLAFATASEAGPPLPLFLDEALTASDPQRFHAVASSLLTFAADGRQIFYLTCDPADVALWEQVAREQGAQAPHVVDLAACRRLGMAFEPRDVPPPTSVAPPPSNGSAEAYAAVLGVPAPDPWRAGDGLHLFHPLRGDLPLLHRLLDQARVETVGHWRSLRKTGQWRALFDADECARVDALTNLVDGVVDAWRVGRGRPVDGRVLAAARIVTGTQLERVAALCNDIGGDARRLVELLEGGGDPRVKGIRHDKRAALRAFFEERGHLVPEAPLDATGIRIRALARVDKAIAAGQLDRQEANARADELIAQLVLG